VSAAIEVRHGYTLADLTGLARGAATANKWLVSDFTVRFEAAWDAITEHLLTSDEAPTPQELARIGKGAVSRTQLKDHCHTYGVAERDLTAGIGSAPRFAAYWFEPPRTPLDEAVCERVALGQVMAALTPRHREFLHVLAASEDHPAAAEALGVTRESLGSGAARARRSFLALWHVRWTSKRPGMPQRLPEAPCGTPGAYQRHLRRGEPADECGCRRAYLGHERDRKNREAA
jgi:hypothetical protein